MSNKAINSDPPKPVKADSKSLRETEERKNKLDILRAHLAQGASQSALGKFVEDYSIEGMISELDQEAYAPAKGKRIRNKGL